MLTLNRMLMIGSAGANVGKTELACSLLERYAKDNEIIGIKVTTIKQRDGQCPRGGAGCGVCSSIDGDFDIFQETDTSSGKDTARLLGAGAKKVYWLRVMQTHLKQGIEALLDIIGPDSITVCESNSLRKIVEPGLFLMVKRLGRQEVKESAAAVIKYADKIVVSDGSSFDLDLDRIILSADKWILRHDATAVILAGGKSGRMGTDKSLLPIKDRSMVETIYLQLCDKFDQVLISANEPGKFRFLESRVVPDKVAGQGPLMAIASALEASKSELNFVIACDIPFIDIGFVKIMLAEAHESGADIVVPVSGGDKFEPLFAVYSRSCLKAINEVLLEGGRRISDIFNKCDVRFIELKADRFANLNTRAEYEQFRAKYNNDI